jgi:hypothetical protein
MKAKIDGAVAGRSSRCTRKALFGWAMGVGRYRRSRT